MALIPAFRVYLPFARWPWGSSRMPCGKCGHQTVLQRGRLQVESMDLLTSAYLAGRRYGASLQILKVEIGADTQQGP